MFFTKKNLKKLENKYGGHVTNKIIGADYVLDDMELTYNFGSQYSAGSTFIKVTNLPKRPITLEVSPKNKIIFLIKNNNFDELYNHKCVVQNDYDFLNNQIKEILIDAKKCDINLTINQYEFNLRTVCSPLYIKKIEKCVNLLLKIKERIRDYESKL